MNEKRKKIISLFLVFSLVSLSGNLMAKERKGAQLAIQKKDGQQVKGELITVKPDSLVLLDAETDYDVSVNIQDIQTIRILKKSKAYEFGLAAFLIGAAVRGAAHSGVRREEQGEEATQHFVGSTIVIGVITGAAGILVGMVFGIDKTIEIEGKSDAEIDAALEKLRKKARVTDYR